MPTKKVGGASKMETLVAQYVLKNLRTLILDTQSLKNINTRHNLTKLLNRKTSNQTTLNKMKDERPMTAEDIRELVDLYTGLDGVDEYLRHLHEMYFKLTGEHL